MQPLVLFCKSYSKDVYRAKRLANSISRFNSDHIPFYMSVPAKDLPVFQEVLGNLSSPLFFTDEEILKKTYRIHGKPPKRFPVHLFQQLIKLEFWRKNTCHNYVWVDSDSYFIRPFGKNDFLYDEQYPYTVQHDSLELRQYSEKYDPIVMEDFLWMARRFKNLFGRSGPDYDFGYPPLIWSCRVLESLYKDYLAPDQKTIFDLLRSYPCEMQLYGEYLHYSKIIPVYPTEPIFKVFHYAGQFFESQMQGECEHSLSKKYTGILIQSNWSTIKRKHRLKMKYFFRRIRRKFRRMYFRFWK